MLDLFVRDVRLLGVRPPGDNWLDVDQNTPLDWPVLWARDKTTAHGGNVYLKILAHGMGQFLGIKIGLFSNSPQYSQGGNGILFCKENLKLLTLCKFAPLAGKLAGIDIMGCGAAYITRGFENRDGDGNVLCSRLAQTAQTLVRASTASQEYYEEPTIDFGSWEGTVLTYDRSGAVVRVENGATAAAYASP